MDNGTAKPPAKTSTYIAGFAISLILTLEAYYLVKNRLLRRDWLIISLAILAIIQLVTQLIAFLHLGKDPKKRWNLVVFSFMLTILIILVFGSLWIMYSLNYHMVDHVHTDSYIIHDEGISQ